MLVSPPVPAQSPLWAFSWRVYQQPSIADQLLRWQDDADIWVNDWLFALWEAQQGSTVCHNYRQIIADWQAWRDEIIVPWRHWRRSCKAGPTMAYEQAKKAELALEWCDQAFLYRHRSKLSEPSGGRRKACLTTSLQRLSGWREGPCSAAADVLLAGSAAD